MRCAVRLASDKFLSCAQRVLVCLVPLALSSCHPEPQYPGELDVPYVQTRDKHVLAMLRLAEVTSGDFLIDLGCGDGRVVVTAAQLFGAGGMGVDLSPDRIAEAVARARGAGVANKVRFEVGNLFDTDLRRATVVTFFLLPDVNSKLRDKLLRELSAGTRVVSYRFPIPDWPADKSITMDGIPIYLHRVPGLGVRP